MSSTPPGLFTAKGEINYGDHAPKASDVSMAELERHIEEANNVELHVDKLKRDLAKAVKEYERITQEVIPEKMAACGLRTVTTRNGLTVDIDNKIFAGLPSVTAINKEHDAIKRRQLIERRDAGLQWLKDNGHKHLIKHTFKVEFGVDQDKDADAFREKLSEYRVHGSEGVDVNAQTLSRVVRELHNAGDNYPGETLGVYIKTVAKITK
jgi:hypothetical protein